MLVAVAFLWRRAIASLALAPTLLMLLLALHGPAYLYYTRVWGPDQAFFNRIVSATRLGSDVIGSLDIAIGITFLGICAGIAIADLVLGCGPRTMRSALRTWQDQPMKISTAPSQHALLLGMLGAAFLLATAVMNDHPGRAWQFLRSQEGEFEKIALRREFSAVDSYWYLLLKSTVIPFSAYALLALARCGWRTAWLGVLLVVPTLVMANLATLSKAPIVLFCMLLALTEILRHTLRPRLRTVMLLGLGGTALLLTMALIAIRTLSGLEAALDFLFYRVFMIVNEVLLEYFAAVPSQLLHTWGAESGWLSALLGQDPQPALFWLVGEVHRDTRASTSNAMFLGEAWGGFSWLGVVVVPVIAGAVVRALDIELIVRRHKSAGSVAGLVLGQYGVFIAMTTAFQTALLSGGLVLVLPLAVWLGAARRRRSSVATTALAVQTRSDASVSGFRNGPNLPEQA
jgi:hypothetical protein